MVDTDFWTGISCNRHCYDCICTGRLVRIKKDKVRIEVFVPLGSCVCNFAPLMEKVGQVTSKFKDLVEVQMKSTKSPEASKYGVQDICVIVDKTVRLSANFDEKELEDAILRRKYLNEG